jgi:hypothetical protein
MESLPDLAAAVLRCVGASRAPAWAGGSKVKRPNPVAAYFDYQIGW